MNETFRRPVTLRADDPRIVMASMEEPNSAETALSVRDAETGAAASARPRRFRWGTVLWSAASGLVFIALGLAVTELIESLFARARWLGTTGLILAAVAGIALLAIIVREVMG